MKHLSVLICLLLFITSTQAAGYKIGDEVKDFSLKNVDGKMLSLKEMKDAKGYIVVFTCNHCPFSKAYEDRIIDLDKKYAAKGYPVVAINPNDPQVAPDDSYENMILRSKEKGFTFPYLYDETQAIATSFGAARTPHVFLIQNSDGKMILKYIGAIDNNTEEPEKADQKFVDSAVESLLNGKAIATQETKAIGCTIKWKQ